MLIGVTLHISYKHLYNSMLLIFMEIWIIVERLELKLASSNVGLQDLTPTVLTYLIRKWVITSSHRGAFLYFAVMLIAG